MASLAIHLAIGKLYCEYHNTENKKDFYLGSILPDLADDKDAAHFSVKAKINDTIIGKTKKRVGIKKVFECKSLKSSCDRGAFLHLVTDYYFYTYFMLSSSMLEKSPVSIEKLKDFKEREYRDFSILNSPLKEKYNLDYGIVPNTFQKYMVSQEGDLQVFNYEDIISFIEKVSKIDLDKLTLLNIDIAYIN